MPMTNLLLQSALEIAAAGLKVMPVYQVDPSGRCVCWKGARCTSPGKHPRINDWQREATDDEETICGWWSRWPMSNLGIQWGAHSNAIDIEFDNDQGRASADKYLGGIVTPSYESGRSIHRIFRFVPAFAGLGATKSGEKVEHLEFRSVPMAKGRNR
jgi:bifunctional DNA primase/polymerase-like protein